MPYLYTALGAFIAGGAVSALYFSSAKAFAQAEAKKFRDELNALKSKAKAKL